MALIRVKNLLLRTFIGFNPDEITNQQDVLINIEIEADIPEQTLLSDKPDGIYNYRTITKQIILLVQNNRFNLLEVLTKNILDLIMQDERVSRARVEVDKPHALRFAESVSFEMEARR
ncbi:MAG TPA: FolB domain-containing protein [Prolixibacteraceae bacterium]|nr:FolB domain-containing protein [Prolixibacteraceae bacterium]